MHIWENFPAIAQRILATHKAMQLRSHHHPMLAMRIGNVAMKIALDEWGDNATVMSAGVAGMCSNWPHILVAQKKLKGPSEIGPADIEMLLREWIDDDLPKDCYDTIIDAAQKQRGRNADDDSHVLIALMDAMRVVNLDSDLFARSGAFYHYLPVIDYEHLLADPTATYREPKSVFRDIAYSLDWAKSGNPVCCRTKLGLAMARYRAERFRKVVEDLQEQLTEEGLWPLPEQFKQ